MRTLTVVTAAFLASQAFGHPTLTTPHRHLQGRAINLEKFRLKTFTNYTNYIDVLDTLTDALLTKRDSYVDTARAVVQEVAPNANFRLVEDHYVGTNGVAHVNFRQTVHGIDIDNSDFNVNIAKDSTVLSYGNSFYSGRLPSQSPLLKRDQIDPVTALTSVSSVLDLSIDTVEAIAEPVVSATETYSIEGTSGAQSAPKASLVYLQQPGKPLALTWRVETDVLDNWILSYVNAGSASDVLGVVNYVAEASYRVYPWGQNDPTKAGPGHVLEVDPQYAPASEFTWQADGSTSYTTTRGNNGNAQANYEGDDPVINDYRPTAAGANFDYDFDPAWSDFKQYANASVTQLWYTANVYHDLLHTLGFNEAAGNFEVNNDGQGGKGNDPVTLNAQDGSGTNNANFATPPDGQVPRMRMYMWTQSTPQRDCSFDAGVVVHEYTHGLSNRLTGGPANSNCLTVIESGGMGEGWSDFMALLTHSVKASDTREKDYVIGDWVFNNPKGIRAYPYSTNLNTNPYTYGSVNGMDEVHAIGTVWSTMLYEVLWNLVEKYGIDDERLPSFDADGVPVDGRFLTMKLVMDGMALQPCNPTFVQARDAILDADQALTGGANQCEIWTGFAKRGLGERASRGLPLGIGLGLGLGFLDNTRRQSFTIPAGVC